VNPAVITPRTKARRATTSARTRMVAPRRSGHRITASSLMVVTLPETVLLRRRSQSGPVDMAPLSAAAQSSRGSAENPRDPLDAATSAGPPGWRRPGMHPPASGFLMQAMASSVLGGNARRLHRSRRAWLRRATPRAPRIRRPGVLTGNRRLPHGVSLTLACGCEARYTRDKPRARGEARTVIRRPGGGPWPNCPTSSPMRLTR
jgi:hypothetical protein